jgi:hypothetical protein
VESVTDVALTVTVLPLGTADGAVYVVAAPLAVPVGLKLPHAPELPQVTDQVTPALAESLLTVAVRDCVALVCREVGGVPLKATLMAGGGGGLELLEPPHAASAAIVLRAITRRTV